MGLVNKKHSFATSLLMIFFITCELHAEEFVFGNKLKVCVDEKKIVGRSYIEEWWTKLLRELRVNLLVPDFIKGEEQHINITARLSLNTTDDSNYFEDIKAFASAYPETIRQREEIGLVRINFSADLSGLRMKHEPGMGDLWYYVSPDFLTRKYLPTNLIPSETFFSTCNLLNSDQYQCERRIYFGKLIVSYEITNSEIGSWNKIDKAVQKILSEQVTFCNNKELN